MKINGDKTTPGYISEKSEMQGRASKTSKTISDKSAKIVLTEDELALTGKKETATVPMRETDIGYTTSVDFDVREVPMLKQRIEMINNYILKNPLAALSAQANLNSESVASLLG